MPGSRTTLRRSLQGGCFCVAPSAAGGGTARPQIACIARALLGPHVRRCPECADAARPDIACFFGCHGLVGLLRRAPHGLPTLGRACARHALGPGDGRRTSAKRLLARRSMERPRPTRRGRPRCSAPGCTPAPSSWRRRTFGPCWSAPIARSAGCRRAGYPFPFSPLGLRLPAARGPGAPALRSWRGRAHGPRRRASLLHSADSRREECRSCGFHIFFEPGPPLTESDEFRAKSPSFDRSRSTSGLGVFGG